MGDFLLSGNFLCVKNNEGGFKFVIESEKNIDDFEKRFGKNPLAKITIKNAEYELVVDKIIKNFGGIVIYFRPANYTFPIVAKKSTLYIPQISTKPNLSPLVKPIRSAALNTNVESGYSAVSFPSVYVKSYNVGPYPGRPQTTPQVGWSYLPPGGGY